MADIVVKISGDIKSFNDALDKVQSKTEDLSDSLSQMTKMSGIAFAALTAEIGLSVAAFGESERASNRLVQALQNQGIYSKSLEDDYKSQAAALQKLTGIDDDAIITAQARLQGMIGQQVITKELTQSILDLSVAKELDLSTTAELIGKGINGHTAALSRLEIQIDETLSKEERTAEIMRIVEQRFGDQAKAANEGMGSIQGLKSAFSDFQEEIGERFAPFVVGAIKVLTQFFQYLKENKAVADLAVSLIAAGAAVTGAATAAGVAAMAFLKFQAAMVAAGIATNGMSLAVRGLVGATGLGLLVLLVTEIYLNWSTVWPKMQAIFGAFVNGMANLGGGLLKILQGAFTLDMTKLKEGLAEAKAAFTNASADYEKILKEGQARQQKETESHEQKQSATKKSAADEQNRIEEEKEARKLATMRANQELVTMQLERASTEAIALKKEEADLLAKMEDEKYSHIRDIIQARLDEIHQLQVAQDELDAEYREEQFQQVLAKNEEYQAMSEEQQENFRIQNEQSLKSQIQNEDSTRAAAAKKRAADQIAANNQFLADQQKFGTAYALINKTMHSEIYQGTKSAFGEMVQMQQSQNSTLKSIGKAAAVASIIIKTAESAMNIYAGFSAIPIVGPALGLAAAAAAIAFGAEQVGRVTAAAQGGLLTGGVAGVDSIPVLAQRGELISPAQNFEEVIGSVRAAREAEKYSGGIGGGGLSEARIIFEMKEEFMDYIETKLVERANIGISLQRVT